MKQRKRLNGTSGIGYYTAWVKSRQNGCIYCGNPATTREHIPSKAFLIEPYPDNLPTLPSCFECNNGYSEDEKYISIFLEIIRNKLYPQLSIKYKTLEIISKDKKLRQILKDQILSQNGKLVVKPNINRFKRILCKLAIGHIAFELDCLPPDKKPQNIWFDFSYNLTDANISDFMDCPELDIAPEIGSRGLDGTAIAVCNNQLFSRWITIQESQYRYLVTQHENSVTAKIIIFDILYCSVTFAL